MSSGLSTIDPGRARLAEILAKKALVRGSFQGGQAEAVQKNHAMAESTGSVSLSTAPAAKAVAVITNFVPTAKGSGKLHVEVTAAIGNAGAAAHKVAVGVAIVAHGAPAPTTWDYPSGGVGVGSNGVTAPAGGAATTAIVVDYGSPGFPPALAPGAAVDIYAMATTDDATPANESVSQHGVQITAQEQG